MSSSSTPITDLSREIDDCVDLLYFFVNHLKHAIDHNHSVVSVVYLTASRDKQLTLMNKLERKFVYSAPNRTPVEGEITPAIINQAKQYPISELIQFNKHGFACCIWHQEKTPSLKLISNNTVHCFGCHKHGDAIDVCREIKKIDFQEAVKTLYVCH